MLARLINNNGEFQLLCKNGSICNANSNVLVNFLSNFKDAKNFHGTDGEWSKEYGDMAVYPGETIAYIADDGFLVIYDFDVFKPVTSGGNDLSSYISVTEYAKKHDVSRDMVKAYCTKGRLVGAQMVGGIWLIPEDAPYPTAPERRRGMYDKLK